MNIIIINDFSFVDGGASQVALSSAIALAEKGHSVTLFSAVSSVKRIGGHKNLKIICTEQNAIANDPNRLRAVTQGLWNFKAQRLLQQVLSTLDKSNTIVHIHSWTKSLSSSVFRVAIKNKFAVVYTMHDYFMACPNGGFFNYQKNSICRLSPLSVQCVLTNCDARSYSQKLWRVWRQVIQRNIGLLPKGVRHIVSVSEFSKSILKPFLPRGSTIYSIANPVEVNKTAPVNVIKNNLFAYVGRLSKEKGALVFAQAATKMGAEAVFVGEGDLCDEVVRACPSAEMTGWLDRVSVNNILNKTRALVFPSAWYETQGLVVLEALARGIPVIVSDACAARDLVLDGETGLWFHSGDVDDLIRSMKIMLDDAVVKEMSNKAFDRYWHQPSTLEHHVDQLEQCYQEVLSKKRE